MAFAKTPLFRRNGAIMKKSLFLPSNFLRPFLVATPQAALLAGAIIMNGTVDTLLKLYPLIIVCILGIIFTFIYFFKAIIISKDEIKYIGPFSSRDRAVINKGKTLIITVKPKGKLAIELFGNDGVNASLDWLKSEATVRDVYLFRGKALGGVSTLKSVLAFFGLSSSDATALLESESLALDLDDYTVTAKAEEDCREIRIRFKKTL